MRYVKDGCRDLRGVIPGSSGRPSFPAAAGRCGLGFGVPSCWGRRCCPLGDNVVDDRAGRADKPGWWGSGDAYEPYVGRWSRPVAREFLGWLAVPDGGRWLDVGCGTGALVESILTLTAPSDVVSIDPSPAYVAFARDRLNDPRVRFSEPSKARSSARSRPSSATISSRSRT
jgi:hypothetical protein